MSIYVLITFTAYFTKIRVITVQCLKLFGRAEHIKASIKEKARQGRESIVTVNRTKILHRYQHKTSLKVIF